MASTHARRRTLLDDVAAQARAKPSSPALHYVDGAESLVLTYAQLISEARAVARGLILACCVNGARVADFCDEGPAIALALLGIALAGGVVVPLDPALPAARLRSLLADADVSLLLCSAASSAALAAKLENSRTPLLALEAVGAAGDVLLPTPTPDALVHLIYTSGSTGAPKAVAVEHGALRAYGWAKIEAHGIRAGCARVPARLGAHVGPVHWRRLLDARRRRDTLRRAARATAAGFGRRAARHAREPRVRDAIAVGAAAAGRRARRPRGGRTRRRGAPASPRRLVVWCAERGGAQHVWRHRSFRVPDDRPRRADRRGGDVRGGRAAARHRARARARCRGGSGGCRRDPRRRRAAGTWLLAARRAHRRPLCVARARRGAGGR